MKHVELPAARPEMADLLDYLKEIAKAIESGASFHDVVPALRELRNGLDDLLKRD